MGIASFGSGWGGRVVEGKFPLLEWLGGSEKSGSFFTVLGGMQEAIIQMILASGVEADACVAQWNFAKNLSHPHLSKVLAAGRSVIDNHELVYVVTEPSNASLSKVIQNQTLQADRIREIFNPVLSALSYLHKNGVVHGHVNPSSIQFDGSKPKLAVTDLLIAGSVKRRIASPGLYDAPELQNDTVTPAADTWAIGMTMYEAMTRASLSPDSAEHANAQVLQSMPSPFREIVQDCLQLDPLRRCSIETILQKLDGSKSSSLFENPIQPESVDALGEATPNRPSEIAIVDAPDAPSFPRGGIGTEESSTPVLFSKSFERFEEAHLTRFRVMPYAVVLFAVITLIAVLLVRGHMARTLPAVANGSPAATIEQPLPERTPVAAAPPVANQIAPASSPTVAEAQANGAPHTETQGLPALNEHSPPSVANHPLPTERTNGSVVKRVLPNVSPGASAGMRIPVNVQLRVSVNQDGTVSNVAYVSPGPGNYFARLAQRAARSWKFAPPTRNGDAEPSVWTLRFYFARKETEATATIEQE